MRRRESKLFLLSLLSFLPHLASPSPDPNGAPIGDRLSPEWQILTKRNFSSQIRSHPHILLLVTLPWSGESRSFQKDVTRLVTENKEKLDGLKLFVVHKNSEKMLADILGATDELTLFYYHHSKRFKYQGRINARSIVKTFAYLLSFQPEEVPLESLHTEEKLKNFLKSTDEAVFLLEFCGWTARVMRNRDAESSESYHSAPNLSENGDVSGDDITAYNVPLLPSEKENLKGLENGNLSCGAENGPFGNPWIGGMSLDMENFSLGVERGRDHLGKFNCSLNEFKQFESFFSNFTIAVRETFFPPETLRIGHISETSLLPFLGIQKPNKWMLLRWVSGCPDCSKILQEGDDLGNFMKMHNSFIVDLDGDKSTHDFAFPANQPSIILFIDRWSELPKVSEASKNALAIFRKFAHEIQLSNQKSKGRLDAHVGASMHDRNRAVRKGTSDVHFPFTNVFSGHKIIKLNDKLSFMVVNEGGKISLESTTSSQEHSAYDLLARFLQQKDPKKTKFSLIAKEVGFKLISDDFEVKVMDSITQHDEIGQFGMEMQNTLPRLDEAAFGFHLDSGDSDQRPSSTSVEDTDKIGSDTSQLDQEHEKLLKATTCRVRSLDLFKDVKCSNEKDNSLGNCHSASLFDNTQELYTSQHNPRSPFDKTQESCTTQNHLGGEQIHHEDGNSDELDVSAEVTIARDPISVASAPEDEVRISDMKLDLLNEKHILDFQFESSFFISDGGYRVLEAFTGDRKLPSVVILDPGLHQHYVLSEDTNFSYASLGSFVYNFSKGNLSPYQRTELVSSTPKPNPHPPFVNLDFHEADAIPRVTAESFSELVLGCIPSDRATPFPCFKDLIHTCASKRDALVLFTNSWCGFCQRMELIVREVYRAYQGLMSMSKNQRMNMDLKRTQGNADVFPLNRPHSEGISSNPLPSIYYMDCTLNDCNYYLESLQKREVYPTLVLFPAGKDAISYEGDISVNGIFDFVAAYGSTSQNIENEYKGILWTPRGKGSKPAKENDGVAPITMPDVVAADDKSDERLTDHPPNPEEKHHSSESLRSDASHAKKPQIVIGSILSATDRLVNAFPFDNSSILMVKADQSSGFQGIILNKRISWNVFLDMDVSLSALKEAPLSYGGPVKVLNLPLVSLTRKALQGYSKVTADLYFGDPVATSLSVDGIRSGNQSAADFWFFLGFSGWEWEQLFGEIARGDWDASEAPIENLVWPEL